MFSRRVSVGLWLAMVACGGSESPMALSITSQSQALLDGIVTARVSLYIGDTSCDFVELSSAAKLGIHNQEMMVQPTDVVASAELFDLREGTYVVAVWGFDAIGLPVAFGCDDEVLIENGQQAEVPITLGRHRP